MTPERYKALRKLAFKARPGDIEAVAHALLESLDAIAQMRRDLERLEASVRWRDGELMHRHARAKAKVRR